MVAPNTAQHQQQEIALLRPAAPDPESFGWKLVLRIRSYLAASGKTSLGQIGAAEVAELANAEYAMERKTTRKPKLGTNPDEEFLQELEASPAYAGIDIRQELGKCEFWCKANNHTITRKRFIAWLNRVPKPLTVSGIGQSSRTRQIASNGIPEPFGWKQWIDRNRPESVYATGQEKGTYPWSALDATAQNYISEQMKANNR